MQTVPLPSTSLSGNVRPLTADEHRQNDDHDWCLSNHQILQQFAGQVMAVYHRKVWGHGPDHEAAVRSAAQALASTGDNDGGPALDELVYVVIPVPAALPTVPSY